MEIANQWKLKEIRIEFQEYGEYKGKYTGRIKFENGESEAFMFNIRPEMAEQYLALMKEEVGRSASQLGEKLIQSLNLLPIFNTPKEIGTEIAHEEVQPETQPELSPQIEDLPF